MAGGRRKVSDEDVRIIRRLVCYRRMLRSEVLKRMAERGVYISLSVVANIVAMLRYGDVPDHPCPGTMKNPQGKEGLCRCRLCGWEGSDHHNEGDRCGAPEGYQYGWPLIHE